MSQALLHLQDTAQALAWLRAQGVTSLTVDSRQVAAGTADAMGFIAWPGAARDGRAFVAQALSAGARACLVEAEGVEAVEVLSVDPRRGLRRALRQGGRNRRPRGLESARDVSRRDARLPDRLERLRVSGRGCAWFRCA